MTKSKGPPKAKTSRSKAPPKPKTPKTFRRDARLEEALRLFSVIKNQTVAARNARVSPKRLRRAVRDLGFAHRTGRGWTITDKLQREMTVTTTAGRKRLKVAGIEAASLVGKHDNAVKLFLQTNDKAVLQPFVGQSISDAAGRNHALEYRPNQLYRLGASGDVFEFIYKLVI